jgi:hypothetical protein
MQRPLRSLIGLATLVAAAAGLWYLFRLLDPAAARHGELVLQVRFAAAGNLSSGAAVRTRGVQVGEVRSIALSPDGTGVLLQVAVARKHQGLVRAGSRFWIVRPRFEGITRGVEGLDTILRNPYVVFDTPEGGSLEPVAAGSLLVGLEASPSDHDLPALQSGDLVFSVLLARSFGLEAGSAVLLRDIRVGEVRSVELDASGQWSSVTVAIRSRYRRTARKQSVFWVQKPAVQSGWLASNIRATELGSLLSGPTLAYFTAGDGGGEPLADGAVVRGALEAPEIPATLAGPMVYVPPRDGNEADRLARAARAIGPHLVGISYSFREDGVFRTYRYVLEGTALLIRDGPRVLAVVPRSLSEGTYVISDYFSRADVSEQQWKLRSGGDGALDARPVWKAAGGADLALLEPVAAPEAQGLERSQLGARLDPRRPLQLVSFRGNAEPELVLLPAHALEASGQAGVFPISGEYARALAKWEGAVALDEQGRPVAILGRRGELDKQPALISLELLASYEGRER